MKDKTYEDLLNESKDNPEFKDKIEYLHSQLKKNNVRPISSIELSQLKIPPKETYLSPWLKEKQLAMIYAPPGIGKTFFCLNCAHAMASGKKFLKFDAKVTGPILYVDGEMDEGELQERWNNVAKGNHHDSIKFLTPALFPDFLVPKISDTQGQTYYDEIIKELKPKVIFFDNISILSEGEESKGMDWNIILNWSIKLKNSGISLVFVHHTNKGKQEHRGSTKMIDHLNTVIFLQPVDDNEQNVAKFKVKYTKKRSFYGTDADDFIAWLEIDGTWHTDDPRISNRQKVFQLYKTGMSAKEISIDLDIQLRTVYRYLDDGETAGMISKRKYGK